LACARSWWAVPLHSSSSTGRSPQTHDLRMTSV
jgi:hypothetical protein